MGAALRGPGESDASTDLSRLGLIGELMAGYANGPFAVDWEARYDMSRLRVERVQAAQSQMRNQGVDGLLVWKDENVRYLTSLDVPGGGGVRIEDMVLVTEGLPRVLSRVEYEESLLL